MIPRISFRSQPKFRDEYSLKFSNTGIQFKTAHIDSNLEWGIYTNALIDADSVILYYGKQQFTIIPNRVFQDTSQRQALETLLRQTISNIVNKTK